MNLDERKFLHDVANPIATALFVADGLLEELEGACDAKDKPAWLEQLKDITQALSRSRDLINARREVLIGKATE